MRTATAAKREMEVLPALADDPAYVAIEDRLFELGDELTTARAETSAAIEKLKEFNQPSARAAMEAAKLKALADGNPVSGETVPDLPALRRRERDLELALELKTKELNEEVGRASYRLRPQALGQHKELGRRIKSAIVELVDALKAEESFRNQLSANGITWGQPLESVAFTAIGLPSDNESRAAFWLRETANYLRD